MKKLKTKLNHLGKGVFANENIEKGSIIFEFKGGEFSKEELPQIRQAEEDRYMQVGENKYLGPSGEEDDLVNHSCNPNSGVFFHKDSILLKAIKDIKKTEEITWDYSTTMKDDEWEMVCHCGEDNCRGLIKEFKHIPKDLKEKYIKLGIVPDYNLE